MRSPRTSRSLFLRIAVVLSLWTLWFAYIFPLSDFLGKDCADCVATPKHYPRFRGSGTVRVCTWNVKNYSVSSGYADGKFGRRPKSEREKSALRRVIADINPDVLLIEEMGDYGFLAELKNDLARKNNVVYDYAFSSSRDSPSRLAVLSRLKPERVFDLKILVDCMGTVSRSPRGTLGAKFSVHGVEWYAFAVHLKSAYGAKRGDERFAPFRFAELRAISETIFKQTGGNAKLLVAGDFNNEPTDALLRNLKPLRLSLLEQRTPDGEDYSYFWKRRGKFFRYDFFLVSEGIAGIADPPASVYVDIDGASDHFPVYADLRLE